MHLGEGLVANGVYLVSDIIEPRELVNTLTLLPFQKRYTPRNHHINLCLYLLKLFIQPLELTIHNTIHFHLKNSDILSYLNNDLYKLFF